MAWFSGTRQHCDRPDDMETMAIIRLLILSRLGLCQMTWPQEKQIRNMRRFIAITALASLSACSAMAEDICAAGYLQQSVKAERLTFWAKEFPEVSFETSADCDPRGTCNYAIVAEDGGNDRIIAKSADIADICETTKRSVGGIHELRKPEFIRFPGFLEIYLIEIYFETSLGLMTLQIEVHHDSGEAGTWGEWDGPTHGGDVLALSLQSRQVIFSWLHEE